MAYKAHNVHDHAMNKHLVRMVLCVTTSLGLWSDSRAAAQPLHSIVATGDLTNHIPALRFEEPRWLPLTEEQIKALFSDRSLVVDENYEAVPGVKIRPQYFGGCPPVETFYADGRWRMDECQRGKRTYEGGWSTEVFRGGERLCVEAADLPKRCRFVWQGAEADRIIMPLASPAIAEILSDRYNPYLLIQRVP